MSVMSLSVLLLKGVLIRRKTYKLIEYVLDVVYRIYCGLVLGVPDWGLEEKLALRITLERFIIIFFLILNAKEGVAPSKTN